MIDADALAEDAIGPFPGCLSADLIRRYASATGERSERPRAGLAVPAVAVVTQIWAAQEAGRSALVSEDLLAAASGGVHGEHDVVLHRPLVPDEPLRTWVHRFAARPAGRNALVTLRYSTVDERDEVVAEQLWTTVYLNAGCAAAGAPLPDHAFPAGARRRPVGEYTTTVDADMPRRYAEVSGDWSDHHFDAAAARRSGFDRPFLHGLCTMALGARAVVDAVAGGDPDRVRRVAVRFAAPAFVGADLRVGVYEAGGRSYAFEAISDGRAVLTHGRVELRGE
ncbi:MaoC/PaaZ C-terminal domain-containing protein [Pseudofrankia inefficax]|uniref:MaoC domain protein dehydratase n=1 Tax=Pseudofrankia inefficax (strain DSM 45817 / CECT 9037 / DDB 130130 / EuI1c) TaxID=298654 RepID=E3J912_PSEI1|nr:MaoC/PaaZ C-terminal domain-containing protein [Pseudofrankia inefficax]ADP80891.1 MaoC domain protein dehydratase [Pseudofrankia inefficax]